MLIVPYLKTLPWQVRCLNEATAGSVLSAFRPWHQRLEVPPSPLKSNDDDPELLIHVPFNGSVKLKAICIIGGYDGSSPSKLRVYINRDDLDFQNVAHLPPVQEWDLLENYNGQIEYPTHVAKFNGVHSIDLHIPSNFGANVTEISFIGLKGEFEERRREAVQAVYESKPLPQDHKVPGNESQTWNNVGM